MSKIFQFKILNYEYWKLYHISSLTNDKWQYQTEFQK